MDIVVANVIESFKKEEHLEHTQGTYEPTSVEEKSNIGDAIFTLDLFLNND